MAACVCNEELKCVKSVLNALRFKRNQEVSTYIPLKAYLKVMRSHLITEGFTCVIPVKNRVTNSIFVI